MRSRRGLRRGLALAVAVLVLGAAEAVARRADIPDPSRPPPPSDSPEIMLHGNPWLLWELTPGVRRELGVTVSVNSAGFRGKERGPRTVPRALALGDSSVYGFGVEDDEVFTARLEARPENQAGGALRAEYVNGAVPGYSTFQAINLLEMRGLALDPQLLLVGTLWSDNNFDSFTDRELLASYAGWEGSWTHDARVLLSRSALFRWLDWQFRVKPAGEHAKKVGWQIGGDAPRTGHRRVAIQDYADNLERLCRTMRQRGGGIVFLELANRVDIAGNAADPAWGPYRRVMEDVAARHGAPVVKVPEVFAASGRSADALFIDQMHPTPLGHALIADAVGKVLDAAGWPETPMTLMAGSGPEKRYTDPFDGTGGTGAPHAPDRSATR